MENPQEIAASKLAKEMESWTSIELQYHHDYEDHDPTHKPQEWNYRGQGRYIETSDGRRMFDLRTPLERGPKIMVNVCYFDGSQSATFSRTDRDGVVGPDEQVAIHRFFQFEERGYTYRPGPLWCLYAGLEPLHRTLSKSVYLGEARLLDRTCDQFLTTRVRGPRDTMSCIHWLDRTTAMPVKVEIFDDETLRAQSRPSSVWQALTLDEIDGHHLALKSEVTCYAQRGPSPNLLVVRDITTIDKVVFNEDYPAETFRPTITEKTRIVDYVKNRMVSPKKTSEPAAGTTSPIRAVEPSGWFPSFSGATLLLGVAAVVAGLGLRWRRR